VLLRVASGSKPIVSISCIVGLGAGRCHVSTHADVTVSAIWKCRCSYRRGRAADRSRKLFSTASMSSPGRSPIPATINARAAISRNSWPSNTTRRLSSPASNGRPRDRRPRSAVPGLTRGRCRKKTGHVLFPALEQPFQHLCGLVGVPRSRRAVTMSRPNRWGHGPVSTVVAAPAVPQSDGVEKRGQARPAPSIIRGRP
jgi:hypothetical protein